MYMYICIVTTSILHWQLGLQVHPNYEPTIRLRSSDKMFIRGENPHISKNICHRYNTGNNKVLFFSMATSHILPEMFQLLRLLGKGLKQIGHIVKNGGTSWDVQIPSF